MSDLTELQVAVRAWHSRELSPNPDPVMTTLKVTEEAGELAGAVVKSREVRNDGIDWSANVRKEMGDVLISLMMCATAHGWSLADVVDERWAVVSQRRYATAPPPEIGTP